MAKRVAFQSLLMKLRLDSTVPRLRRESTPADPCVARAKRSASAPYSSVISVGSSTLPLVLLILSPSASRTVPCR